MAASPALEGTPRDIIVTLGQIGLFLVSPAFLLAACLLFFGLVAVARKAAISSDRATVSLVFYLALVGAVLFAYTLLPTQNWLTIAFNLLLWIALLWMAVRFATQHSAPIFARAGVVMAVLAYSGWYLYVLVQQISLGTQTGEQTGVWVISLGELLAVLTPIALFIAIALPGEEWRRPRRWIAPVVLALLFAAGNIADSSANMGFTGVFTTWSVGVNIAWPWPIYAVSLALYAYGAITCFTAERGYANSTTGVGLILLLLAGYNLQTSHQHLLALLAVALLSGLIVPFASVSRSRAEASVPDVGNQRQSATFERPAHPR